MRLSHSPSTIAHFAILLTLLLFSGCAAETPQISQEELYVRDFISKYGVPDQEHSWSMASKVDANVAVEGVSTGTLEIFTAPPGTADARLAARLAIVDGRADGAVALPAGMKDVYMQVKDRGNSVRMVSRSAVLQNSITQNIAVTSMPGDDRLPTVEDYEHTSSFMPTTIQEIYQEYIRDHHESVPGVYSYTDCNEWFKTTGRSYFVKDNGDGWTSTELQTYIKMPKVVPQLKMLNNLYYEMGPALSYRTYLSPIFDHYHNPETGELEDGVFKEGQDNIAHYYHNNTSGYALDPNVTFSVHEEGPVTMQCIWRGTQYDDYFGYYYYDENEVMTAEKLFNDIPKYTFITGKEISESSNLTQVKTLNHAYDGGDYETGWTDLDGMGTATCSNWIDHDGDNDRLIRGRKYYLAYFGENYDQAPSYTFPTGVRIGYFLFRNGKFYFSDCRLQYQLTLSTYNKTNEDLGETGRPYAAKFRMQGRTYVGFGDESGDCDLNDVVFIAENVYPDPTDITPPSIKEEEDNPEPLRWTLACEDLGSTDDTDFNDIVVDIEHVAGSGQLTLIPRAAGGVLVSNLYFRQGDSDVHSFVGEIHNLLSSAYPANPRGQYEMLNTQRDSHHVDPRTVRKITLSVPDDFDFADPENGFLARVRITTRHYDESERDANVVNAFTDVEGAGKIPQMLLLNENWYWPIERADITEAYPRFKQWVGNASLTDWTSSRNPASTVSHRDKCSH